MINFTPNEEELFAELAEQEQTTPDVPLEELTFEQLAALQRAVASVAKVSARRRRSKG